MKKTEKKRDYFPWIMGILLAICHVLFGIYLALFAEAASKLSKLW